MPDSPTAVPPRRGFLARVGAVAALGVTGALPFDLTRAAHHLAGPDPDATDKWLVNMKGKHRQLFDMPHPSEGVPLLHIRNFLMTYHDAYGMADKDINAIGTLYGKTVPLAFQDSMWGKYKLGESLHLTDAATNAPLARNMFAHPQQGDAFAFGVFDASIEALQKRGVLFLLCNNALGFWVGQLAKGGMGTAEAIRADLLANLLPGVVLVPAMVVAINKAQEHGFSYMYLA